MDDLAVTYYPMAEVESNEAYKDNKATTNPDDFIEFKAQLGIRSTEVE